MNTNAVSFPASPASIGSTGLVYLEPFKDVRDAIAREKQIKAWTRAKRIALIEAMNPTWADLAEDAAKRWQRVEQALSAEGKRRAAAPSERRSADSSLRSE